MATAEGIATITIIGTARRRSRPQPFLRNRKNPRGRTLNAAPPGATVATYGFCGFHSRKNRAIAMSDIRTVTVTIILRKLGAVILASSLTFCGSAAAQTSSQETSAQDQQATNKPTASSISASEDYKIGPGDVVSVTVPDAPEFGGKFRVTDSGVIQIAGVAAPVQAEGLSPIELAQTIRQALIDAKQLRDPKV